MARKAAHDQRSTPTSWVCIKCREGDCPGCVDNLRIRVGITHKLCNCRRKNHTQAEVA